MTTLTVNGFPRPLGDAKTLLDLLNALGVKAPLVAVERNGEIIPAADLPGTLVSPGDRIEIIQFVGGG